MPFQLLSSLAFFESAYNPKAVSSAGARGVSQFMAGTWAEVMGTPFSNAFDPEQSIIAMGRYLETLRLMFWDNALDEHVIVAKMVTAYCWGPGRVQRQGLRAAPQAVKRYVDRVLSGAGYQTFFE